MKRVILESPYGGDTAEIVERNLRYLRAALRDSITRGEAPFASHAIYTQPGVLLDHVPEERALGIQAGFEWRGAAEKTVVYTDLGVTSGMLAGITHARWYDSISYGHEVEYRELGQNWDAVTGDLATSKWGQR